MCELLVLQNYRPGAMSQILKLMQHGERTQHAFIPASPSEPFTLYTVKQLLSHEQSESSHSGDHFLLSSLTFNNVHSQFSLSGSPSDYITASSQRKTDINQYFYHSKNDHFHHMWFLLLSSVA